MILDFGDNLKMKNKTEPIRTVKRMEDVLRDLFHFRVSLGLEFLAPVAPPPKLWISEEEIAKCSKGTKNAAYDLANMMS